MSVSVSANIMRPLDRPRPQNNLKDKSGILASTLFQKHGYLTNQDLGQLTRVSSSVFVGLRDGQDLEDNNKGRLEHSIAISNLSKLLVEVNKRYAKDIYDCSLKDIYKFNSLNWLGTFAKGALLVIFVVGMYFFPVTTAIQFAILAGAFLLGYKEILALNLDFEEKIACALITFTLSTLLAAPFLGLFMVNLCLTRVLLLPQTRIRFERDFTFSKSRFAIVQSLLESLIHKLKHVSNPKQTDLKVHLIFLQALFKRPEEDVRNVVALSRRDQYNDLMRNWRIAWYNLPPERKNINLPLPDFLRNISPESSLSLTCETMQEFLTSQTQPFVPGLPSLELPYIFYQSISNWDIRMEQEGKMEMSVDSEEYVKSNVLLEMLFKRLEAHERILKAFWDPEKTHKSIKRELANEFLRFEELSKYLPDQTPEGVCDQFIQIGKQLLDAPLRKAPPIIFNP